MWDRNVWGIILGIIWGFEMCQVFLVPAPAWGKELPACTAVLVTVGLVNRLRKKGGEATSEESGEKQVVVHDLTIRQILSDPLSWTRVIIPLALLLLIVAGCIIRVAVIY